LGGRGRPVSRLLLAVSPTARPATALLGGGTRLSVVVRGLIGCGLVDGQCINFEGFRGGRGRRLLLRLLASEPGQWQTISPESCARAASPANEQTGAGARRGWLGKALA